MQAMGDCPEQTGADATALPLLQNVDVLQLGVGAVTARMVVGHVADRLPSNFREENPAVAAGLSSAAAVFDVPAPAASPECDVAIVPVDGVGKRGFLGGNQDADDGVGVVGRGTADMRS